VRLNYNMNYYVQEDPMVPPALVEQPWQGWGLQGHGEEVVVEMQGRARGTGATRERTGHGRRHMPREVQEKACSMGGGVGSAGSIGGGGARCTGGARGTGCAGGTEAVAQEMVVQAAEVAVPEEVVKVVEVEGGGGRGGGGGGDEKESACIGVGQAV
jgi:hypothetical protein